VFLTGYFALPISSGAFITSCVVDVGVAAVQLTVAQYQDATNVVGHTIARNSIQRIKSVPNHDSFHTGTDEHKRRHLSLPRYRAAVRSKPAAFPSGQADRPWQHLSALGRIERPVAPLFSAVRRESNVNFLFQLSLEFYRLVSSSVARGTIPNDQRPVRRPLGFHGLAEIKRWNRSRTGNCGKEPSGDRPDGSCYSKAWKSAVMPSAWTSAWSRSIGDFYFLNVPLPFAAVSASSCSVPARQQAVISMEQL
jgi:hypothetical protein